LWQRRNDQNAERNLRVKERRFAIADKVAAVERLVEEAEAIETIARRFVNRRSLRRYPRAR
jgi:hypothetical protein